MGNKLHTIIHTINGTVSEVHTSWHEDLVVNKLPKDLIHKPESKDLLHFGSFKKHIGNTKHCFYYTIFNTI